MPFLLFCSTLVVNTMKDSEAFCSTEQTSFFQFLFCRKGRAPRGAGWVPTVFWNRQHPVALLGTWSPAGSFRSHRFPPRIAIVTAIMFQSTLSSCC